MRTKLLLIFLFMPTITWAIEEIPTVTIAPDKDLISYRESSILKSRNPSYVISSKEIKNEGTILLTNAINSVNSAQIINNGRNSIDMRGFGQTASSNTLILMDGEPVANPDAGVILPYLLPIQEIERIEIVPKSGSILYGDQAVGGMVNIITKGPEKEKVDASATIGNFATYQAQAGISKSSQKYDAGYRLSGSFYRTKNYRDHNKERINNLNFIFSFKKFYFRYRKFNQQLELPSGLTKAQAEKNPHQSGTNIGNDNQDHDFFQLGFSQNFSENWMAKINLNADLMEGKGRTKSTFTNSFTKKRKTLSVRPRISGAINIKKLSILPIIGADLSYGKYKYSSGPNLNKYNYFSDNSQKQGAAYGELTIPIAGGLSVIGGARYGYVIYQLSKGENRKPSDNAFITSAELKWQPIEDFSIFARRSENYRFPKTDEITDTYSNNPLKTQTGASYEAGSYYKNKYFLASVTGYQLDLKNEISFAPNEYSTQSLNYRNRNLDDTRRRGIIASLNIEPVEFLQLKGDYNFVDPKFTKGIFNGKQIPFVARNNARGTVIFKPIKYIHLLFEGVYTGSRYQGDDFRNEAEKAGAFTIYNCGFRYKKDFYTLTVRSNNITNKLYYGFVKYNSDSSSSYYPAGGMNILGTFSIEL